MGRRRFPRSGFENNATVRRTSVRVGDRERFQSVVPQRDRRLSQRGHLLDQIEHVHVRRVRGLERPSECLTRWSGTK